MFDASETSRGLQRAAGGARVALALKGGRTRLCGLRQSGSAKAMLPRVHADEPEVVFLNTAGGLTGGDALDYGVELGAGARATATTQTAERAYDAGGAPARVDVRLDLGPGAALDWLPQETILFDRAALVRETRVALGGDARLLMAETVVLGRAAMRETVRAVALTDRREVRRDGVPLVIDTLALDDALLERDGAALLRGARAVASIVMVGPGAEDAVAPLRRLLDGEPVEAAVSGWDGRLVARLFAPDGFPLRRAMARALTHLRQRPLPRVWQT